MLRQSEGKKCVIFAGGFHQEGIKNYFAKKNIRCIPIIPTQISFEDSSINYKNLLQNSDSVFRSLQASTIAVEALFQSEQKTAEVITHSALYRVIDLIDSNTASLRQVRRRAIAFVDEWKSNLVRQEPFNEHVYEQVRSSLEAMENLNDILVLPVPYRDGYFIALSKERLTKQSFPPQKGITHLVSIDAVEGFHTYLIRTEKQVDSVGSRTNTDGRLIWASSMISALLLTVGGSLSFIEELLLNNLALIDVARFGMSFLLSMLVMQFTVFRLLVSGVLGGTTLLAPRKPRQFFVPDELYPEVTLQFPVRNEPFEAVKMTVDQALRQDYPRDKLHIQIIDNSEMKDPALRINYTQIAQYAEENGIQIIHRDGTKGAKVGNLNLGFRGDPDRNIEPARGELLCCIDAETKFPPDALKRLIPMYVLNRANAGSFRLGTRYGYSKTATPTFAERGSIFAFNFMGSSERVSDNYAFTPTPGDFLLVSREVLEDMGGWLPEAIEAKVDKAEDHALTYELLLRGRNVVLVNTDKPFIGSGHPLSFRGRLIQLTRYSYGSIQLLKAFLKKILFSKRIAFQDKAYSVTRMLGDLPLLIFAISIIYATFTGSMLVIFFPIHLFGTGGGYFFITFLLPLYFMSAEFRDFVGKSNDRYRGWSGFLTSLSDFGKNMLSFFFQAIGSYVEVLHAQISSILNLKKPFVSPPRSGEERVGFFEVLGGNTKTFFILGSIVGTALFLDTIIPIITMFQQFGVPGALSYVSYFSIPMPWTELTTDLSILKDSAYVSSGAIILLLMPFIPFIMDWNPAKDVRSIKNKVSQIKSFIKAPISTIQKSRVTRWLSSQESISTVDQEVLRLTGLLDALNTTDRALIEQFRNEHSLTSHEIVGFAAYKKHIIDTLSHQHGDWVDALLHQIRANRSMSAVFDDVRQLYDTIYPAPQRSDRERLLLVISDAAAITLFESPVKPFMTAPRIQELLRFMRATMPEQLSDFFYDGKADMFNETERQHFYLSKLTAPTGQTLTAYGLADLLPSLKQFDRVPGVPYRARHTVLQLIDSSL